MGRSLEIVVPEECMTSVARDLQAVPRTRVVTQPSAGKKVRRLCFATRQAVERPESDLVGWAAGMRKRIGEVPFVFVSHASHFPDDWKVAQRMALLSATAKKVTPFVAPDADAARRIALAQLHGAEDRLIASAEIQGDTLEVWSCEPRPYRVPIASLPALARLSQKGLRDFTVSSSGSRLHWEDGDIDMSLDAIRAAVDPELAEKHRDEFRDDAARYGRAIRLLRDERGIRQAQVKGVTDRNLRRIELGQVLPRTSTLRKLAAAHGMTLPAYMDALAARMHS
jgi:hypothetical protein